MISECKYEIIGRCTDGTSVFGYILKGKDGTNLVTKSEVERLAIDKKISNVTAQVYNGKIILKGLECKLSRLPNYDKNGSLIPSKQRESEDDTDLRITARVISGKNIVGYVVTLLSNGDTVDTQAIQKDKIIELTKNGYISNARVQMLNGKYVLRGVNCELARLPSTRLVTK